MMRHRIYQYAVSGILGCASVIALLCNNPASNKYGCDGPTVNGCSGNPCSYVHIYDAEGNFVAESGGNTGVGQVYWDGTDCSGNKVPCGRYTVQYHLVYSGMEQQTTEDILVTDSSSIKKTGRKACDSLKAICTGNYSEISGTAGIGDDGNIYSNEVGCVCCK